MSQQKEKLPTFSGWDGMKICKMLNINSELIKCLTGKPLLKRVMIKLNAILPSIHTPCT